MKGLDTFDVKKKFSVAKNFPRSLGRKIDPKWHF